MPTTETSMQCINGLPAYVRHYFKALDDEPAFMSGLPLPNPDKGPYYFQECEFHPRLWEALQQTYLTSTFDNCNFTPIR